MKVGKKLNDAPNATPLYFGISDINEMGRELDALRLQLQEIKRERDSFSHQVENFKEENEELKELWRKLTDNNGYCQLFCNFQRSLEARH